MCDKNGIASMKPLPDILDLTFPQLLRHQAEVRPNTLALSARSADGWRDRLTYAELVQRMGAMAAALAAGGCVPGNRIAVLLDNWAGREAILTALGALRLGAVVCPLNTQYPDPALQHALALIAPQIIVATSRDTARLRKMPGDARILIVGDTSGADCTPGLETWPDPRNSIASDCPDAPNDNGILGCLLFTSGTTALPKAVMHTHRSMIGAGLCCGTALGLKPGDIYHGGWPFFTSSGLNLGCASAWATGGGLVFEEPLDNAGRLNLIAQEKSTFYHGVPSVIQFLIDEYPRGTYDLSSLRRVGYGGAAMPSKVIQKINWHWPHVEQVQFYGMTESGPSGTVLEPAMTMKKFGSVGRAMPYCDVKIIGSDGENLPLGTAGEIVLSGPAIATGYLNNPDATADAFRDNSVRTGDIGYLDADGYLFFTDRLKDIINRGGLKIASIAVEEVLCRHPSISEAAVVSVPHDALGEDIGACIVATEGCEIDLEALAAFCTDHLAANECPRHWRVLDMLPKNPMGKILKTDLRELFSALD